MQEAIITFYLRQSWTDPRLAYRNFNMSAPLPTRVRLDKWDDVWVPDSFFRLATREYVSEVMIPNRLMTVSKDGEVWYVVK